MRTMTLSEGQHFVCTYESMAESMIYLVVLTLSEDPNFVIMYVRPTSDTRLRGILTKNTAIDNYYVFHNIRLFNSH